MEEHSSQNHTPPKTNMSPGWKMELFPVEMGVSENRATPKSSILIGFSLHFGVPRFLETPKWSLFKVTC